MYKLQERHIPTPLIPEHARDPVPTVPFKKQRFRDLYVLSQLLMWVVRMLWIRLTTRDEEARGYDMGRATRETVERVGYLWIKVGQLVSTREDLLSEGFSTELARLQWQATGFPPALAREVIERELGGPVERFFDDFEDDPLAAASIAQVHRARLKDGTRVVVKVQRPESDKIFLDDMAFLNRVVKWMSRFDILAWINLEEVIWELDQMMREEVDLRYELNNIKRLRKQLRKHRIYIPKPYGRYSTERILVMEYLPGVLVSDYVRIRNQDPERLEDWLRENNIDVRRVARRLYMSFLRQVFEENQFHGDLHPGNIMLLRDSRLAFIDLGTVGAVERTLLKKFAFLTKAVANHEFDRAVDLMLALVPTLPIVDLEPIREDMIRALRAWSIRTPIKSLPYHSKALMAGVLAVLRVMTANRIMVTWSFLRILRSRSSMDSALNHMVPELNQIKLHRRYFRRRERRTLRRMRRPSTLRHLLASLPDILGEYGLFINPLLRRASRVFAGYTSKLGDIAQALFRLFAQGFLASVVLIIPLYIQAYHPQYLDSVPWISRFLRGLPSFVIASEWMSRFAKEVWILGLALDIYVFWLVRSAVKRLGEEEIRLPDSSQA